MLLGHSILSSVQSQSRQGVVGSLAELAIPCLVWCRHTSTEIAHILLLWSKHHLGSCVVVEGALLLQAVGKGKVENSVCHDNLKSMVKTMC